MEEFLRMMGNLDNDGYNHISVLDDLSSAMDFVIDYNRQQEPFKPGDLIVWKPQMKDRKMPEYGQPIMVLEVFSPVRDDYLPSEKS